MPKECLVRDVWSREVTKGVVGIREEQHKFYWLAKEELG